MAIREILFPTDFSEPSQYAGQYAAALARKLGASLHVLHVLVFGSERKSAEAQLKAFVSGEDFQGLRLSTTLTSGEPADEVIVRAAAHGTDLVVMGTHGRTGLSRAILGSVTEKVIRQAPRPVLAIRHPNGLIQTPWGATLGRTRQAPEEFRFQKLLVPLDGSVLAEGILPQAKDLTRHLKAELTLLTVAMVAPPFLMGTNPAMLEKEAISYSSSYVEAKRHELEAEGVPVQAAVRYGHAALQILDYAESQEIDLIAMATHGRSGLDRWLLGSVAEKVLRGSDIPLLLYRAWTPSK